MARKNNSPLKVAMREMMSEYQKNNDISIKSGTDVISAIAIIVKITMRGCGLGKCKMAFDRV